MKRLRHTVTQQGPSLGLDRHGDPLPVKYETGYEVEKEPGHWYDLATSRAKRLLREGKAKLVR